MEAKAKEQWRTIGNLKSNMNDHTRSIILQSGMSREQYIAKGLYIYLAFFHKISDFIQSDEQKGPATDR